MGNRLLAVWLEDDNGQRLHGGLRYIRAVDCAC
jgi:hypothetical protein